VIKTTYTQIINSGVDKTFSNTKNKRIKLLNTYVLIWMHFTLLFPLLDVIIEHYISVASASSQLITFLSMLTVVLLNKNKMFNWARLLFMITAFANFFSFSVIVLPGCFMEYYYIIIPGFALSLFTKNIIPWISLFVSFVLYLTPYYFIKVYPQDIANRIEVPAMLGVFLSIFFLVKYFKKINLGNESKLEMAYEKLKETKKSELAHLQLKSLKAQMNPHFMFNAMNSIQGLVLKGDKHEAYQYLSKFSAMIRENLNMSEKSFVLFEEELSLLNKYLELEKLRFRDEFNYKLIGIENINDIKIPSMIIQPFVENAIKHGLLHKTDGVKKIEIEFKQTDVFKCIIHDNGIGILQSQKIKEKRTITHQSFSTNAIKERLTLLKEYYKTDIGFEYIPVSKGTKVIVKIPYTLGDE